MALFPFENPPVVEEHPDSQRERRSGPTAAARPEHFSAKYVWSGHGWKARDFNDCPFGHRHFILTVAPDTHFPVYCRQCEQHGQGPLQGEPLVRRVA